MSKLKELIHQFCPNGVANKPVWELTAWDKKFTAVEKSKQKKIIKYKYLLAADLKALEEKSGNVKILTTNKTNLWTTEEKASEALAEGEIVCIPWGGNAVVQYYNGKFVTGDNRIATSLDTNILDNKYLYYCMLNQLETISSFYRGSGIQHPDMVKVLDLEIPLPDINVQLEIVRILDKFALLLESINEELLLRKKQYDYYSGILLDFDDSVTTVPLREIVDFKNGKGHEKVIDESGEYIVVNSKFISTQGDVVKHTKEQICPLFIDDILMVMSDLPNGRALAKCFLVKENNKYTLNQRIGAFHVKKDKKVLTKYLFYILNRNPQLLKYDNGTDQTNLRKDDILDIRIPVPDESVQKKIIERLDVFDKICNSAEEGLSKEIKLRDKQFTYYLNRLLTFVEM